MSADARGGRHAVLVALVAVAAYLPAVWTGFTSDDFFILARLKQFEGLADPLAYFRFGFFEYYRPIAFLSHAADWQIWQLDPRGYHLTSVLLHGANTALVFAIGRRLAGTWAATAGALLFALHPANHEAVYWMAARFDLLATALGLGAVLWLTRERPGGRVPGLAAFGLALLAKESAVAVVLIVLAWDVVVARRRAGDVMRRLWPLLAVAVVYAALRSLGAELDPAGGARRLPKLVLFAGLLALLAAAATAGADRVRRLAAEWRPPGGPLPLLLAIAVVVFAATVLAPSAAWTREKLGFVAYAAFHLASPVVFPSPPAWLFNPVSFTTAVPGTLVALAVLPMIWLGRCWLLDRPAPVFLVLFTVATLVPVLSLTGGTRYLYLPSAGFSLLAGLLLASVAAVRRRTAVAVVAVVLAVSATQLVDAARAWRWASRMTEDALAVMTDGGRSCPPKDIVLLTAPAGLRGVYCNLLWDAFDATTDCPPDSFVALLRVVGADARVDVTARADGGFDLRVPDYRGQFVTSRDQRHFDVPVPAGAAMTVATSVGELTTWPEAGTQRFRLAPADAARGAAWFAYSAGRLHAVTPAR